MMIVPVAPPVYVDLIVSEREANDAAAKDAYGGWRRDQGTDIQGRK